MPLINCPECRREISDKALSCPHCGYPLEKTSEWEDTEKTSDWEETGFARAAREIAKAEKRKRFIWRLNLGLMLFSVAAILGTNLIVRSQKEQERKMAKSAPGREQIRESAPPDPCANIKTMDDWHNAGFFWRISNGQCNPKRIEEKQRKAEEERLFQADLPRMQAALQKSVHAALAEFPEYGIYHVEIEVRRNSYSATLYYQTDPLPEGADERLCRAAVLAILQEIMTWGIQPAKSQTGAYASIYSLFKGVTGKNTLRQYGMASYNDMYDNVKWDPKPKLLYFPGQ